MSSCSKALLCFALVVCLSALGAPALLAQGVTTGALNGLVTDQDGGTALPGAVVTAIHEPTGTRYNTVTRADGRFDILGARAGGPYTVTATMAGFKPAENSNVFIRLGEATTVSFRLQLETISESLTVVAESSPLINKDRTGAASNVSTAQIENLPTIGRGLTDFARTNPFFTVSSENEDPEAISVAGRSSRYNNIQIDGAVNNDLFGLADSGTPGGQANTNPISLDAIQEIQLVLAPFDVRQGGFSGGGVNAITRSGTNAYQGSAFYFTRDDSLVGDVKALGDFGTFSEDVYGARLGGPISRDKSFFFINGEISESETPTGWSIDGSGGQAFGGSNNAAVQVEAQRFRQALIDRFGYDPGSLGQQVRSNPSDKFFGRLDFNLSNAHNLTFRHNYVDATNDVNRPSSRTFEFPSETYLFSSETNSTVLQLNSVFGSTAFNEARISYQTIRDNRGGVQQPFPWIEIEDVGGFGIEFEVGTEPFSTRNSLDQDILEITNDFTWLKGNHTVTIGTHNEFFTFDNLFVQNAFGSYEFETVDDFLAGNSRRYRFGFVNPGQPDSQQFDVQQLGFYVGDQWRARTDLTLTMGLRLDTALFPDDPSRNPFTESTYGLRTDTLPDGELLWSPRLGFNWDIGGNGTDQLRGGTGIFTGRAPYVWISNNYARTGIEQSFIQAFGVPFNPDPNSQPTNVGGASTGEFNLIDPNFEYPQVWRVNLAYDKQLPWWGLVASIEGIYSDSIQEIDYKDVNLVQTGTVPFDGRPTYTRLDSSVSGAYLITNTSEGEATNIAAKLERPYRNGWWGSVSYAYGDATVVNDGTSSRAVSNFQFTEAVDPNNVPATTSDFEVEHRFNAALSYTTGWGRDGWDTTIGLFYNHQAGRAYSNIYGSQSFPSINQDRYFGNDLIYVPATAGDVVFYDDSIRGVNSDPAFQAAQWALLDAYVNADSCLDRSRGGIAPRNCSKAPWSHSLDLRIAQDIPTGRYGNLQVTLDIANLGNLIDEDSGQLRYANFNTVTPIDYRGTTSDGRPIYGLNSIVTNPEGNDKFDTHNLLSRWRAKLGLRWSF